VLLLKAKIWPKTTKSSHGKVPVKASSQPEFRTQKKILRGDGAPRGGGTDPPIFFTPMNSNLVEICEK